MAGQTETTAGQLDVFQYARAAGAGTPGDYDGDGDTDIAVFRPATGTWFVMGRPTVAFGTNGDVALPLAGAIQEAFF